MEKEKEGKLEKLRIDSESANARAEKAEAEVKELKAELAKKETEVQNLNNKVSLLQMDLERAEKRVEEVKLKKAEGDKEETQMDALKRKVQMLETQLDEKDKSWREATDKVRSLEVHAEHHERKGKQLDSEKGDLEKKYEELQSKYNAIKGELESTLKSLEDLKVLLKSTPHLSVLFVAAVSLAVKSPMGYDQCFTVQAWSALLSIPSTLLSSTELELASILNWDFFATHAQYSTWISALQHLLASEFEWFKRSLEKDAEDSEEASAWSGQTAIFHLIQSTLTTPLKALLVPSKAGTGKTTTLIHALRFLPPDSQVLLISFNREVKQLLEQRLRTLREHYAGGVTPNVDVRTFHGLGRALLVTLARHHHHHQRQRGRGVDSMVQQQHGGKDDDGLRYEHKIDKDKTHLILTNGKYDVPFKHFNYFANFVSLAKTNLLRCPGDPTRGFASFAGSHHQDWSGGKDADDKSLMELRRLYNIFPSEVNKNRDPEAYRRKMLEEHEIVRQLLRESNQMSFDGFSSVAPAPPVIDFDDMLYLPSTIGASLPKKYDYVFVDEAQDLSEAKVRCLRMVCGDNTKLAMFGDHMQNIYQFAGSTSNLFEHLSKIHTTPTPRIPPAFQSFLTDPSQIAIQPLSVNLRCHTGAIKVAQLFDRDIQARPDAPRGQVLQVTHTQFSPRSSFASGCLDLHPHVPETQTPLSAHVFEQQQEEQQGKRNMDRVLILAETNSMVVNYALHLLGACHVVPQVLGRGVGVRLESFWKAHVGRLLKVGFAQRVSRKPGEGWTKEKVEELEKGVGVGEVLKVLGGLRVLVGRWMREFEGMQEARVDKLWNRRNKKEKILLDGLDEQPSFSANNNNKTLDEQVRELHMYLDRFDSIFSICMHLPPQSTAWDLHQILTRVDSKLFPCPPTLTPSPKEDPFADVTLSTIHRSRGLERDQVYYLSQTLSTLHFQAASLTRSPRPGTVAPWFEQYMKNLSYIACTRPRKVLGLVEFASRRDLAEFVEPPMGRGRLKRGRSVLFEARGLPKLFLEEWWGVRGGVLEEWAGELEGSEWVAGVWGMTGGAGWAVVEVGERSRLEMFLKEVKRERKVWIELC
ncbi:hypothetical protein HDV05_005971 [Chytridiales sp. JEL 0842]|nr:hypothetical protein HDV05_005971 [Chytridiales sp. JEL 0842]